MRFFYHFFTFLFLLISPSTIYAGGGKLVILMEESPITDQWYKFSEVYVKNWTDPDHHSFDFHKHHWKENRQIISTSNSPFGWCYVTGKNFLPQEASQDALYYGNLKSAQEKLEKERVNGYFVTSLAHGKAWEFVISTCTGFTDQVLNEKGFKSVLKWAKPYIDKGYRITAMTPSMTKWLAILTLGTDIDKQECVQYNNYDEFISGLNKFWEQNYSLQLAEVSPGGKYVGVFCTYKSGKSPKQVVTVASTPEEARAFINKHSKEGYRMVHFGGSYEPGLLCNYDSAAEKANAILGITSGILTSSADLANQISSNKKSQDNINTQSEENIPTGLSAAEYQDIYDRFARNAEGIVNSLTSASQSSSTYTIMKKQLREAQRSMRKTREEARRVGHSITQSKWETANVTL